MHLRMALLAQPVHAEGMSIIGMVPMGHALPETRLARGIFGNKRSALVKGALQYGFEAACFGQDVCC